MNLINLFFHNPILFVILTAMLLYSIIAHEVAHGFTALFFGDDTAKRYGRLTLNPVSHIDIIGAVMLFVVGFGWAKPVPVNYNALRNTRFGLIAVALAGCLANLAIATAAALLLRSSAINSHPALSQILSLVVRINIILGSFNLIPIPPLDGSKVLMWFLPENAQMSLARIEPYGFFILAFFLFTGLLNPVIVFMETVVYGMINWLVGLFG